MAVKLIEQTEDTCGGRMRIAGRRIPTMHLHALHLQGAPVEELCSEYDLTPEQVWAALIHEGVGHA